MLLQKPDYNKKPGATTSPGLLFMIVYQTLVRNLCTGLNYSIIYVLRVRIILSPLDIYII